MTVFDKTQAVFRDIFDDEALAIRRDMTASDIDDWDSLAHINLIVAIEKEFSIKFAIGELQKLQNVGDLLDTIEKKTQAK
jgi:acyl carrier protein